MKRSQIKRTVGLKASPEKTEEFIRRSQDAARERQRAQRADPVRAPKPRLRRAERPQEAAEPSTRPKGPAKPRKRPTGRKANPVAWTRFSSLVIGSRCPVPGCRRRPYELPHHVVYQQEVRRRGGDVSDPRNALPPCEHHHDGHHAQGDGKLELSTLRDENFAFAAELLGSAAYNYLRRRYAGEDPRLDELREIEAADRPSPSVQRRT